MGSIIGNLSYLMFASFLVQTSNAAITTMIAMLIALRGGTQTEVSLVAGCYALGFVLGCFAVPSQVTRVGLIRVYAAAAAMLTISILGVELFDGAVKWALLRFVMGFSIAAVLAVSDAWINSQSTSEIRGRVIATYAIVLGLGSVISQLVFVWVDVETDDLILLFAILMNLSVVLVALNRSSVPKIDRKPARKFKPLVVTSFTASLTVFVAGFATTSLITLVPFYLSDHGVPSSMVAAAVMAIYLGRLVFQWPIGIISDRVDRRLVLVALATIAAALLLTVAFIGPDEGRFMSGDHGLAWQWFAFAMGILLGATVFPMYSVASSLAFDRADSKSLLDVSTTLLVLNSIGSITGPFTVMALSSYLGDSALGASAGCACLLVAIVAVYRKSSVENPAERTPSMPIPPTSLEMARTVAELADTSSSDTKFRARSN